MKCGARLLDVHSLSGWASVGLTHKILIIHKGIARTQSPTNKNYALELPTFGAIVGVSLTEVQWKGLTLEEPPSWSWFTSVPGKYAITRNWKTLFLWHKADFFWQETFTFLGQMLFSLANLSSEAIHDAEGLVENFVYQVLFTEYIILNLQCKAN